MIPTGFGCRKSHVSSDTCADSFPVELHWIALLSSRRLDHVQIVAWALIFISKPFASLLHGPMASMASCSNGAMDLFLEGKCPTLWVFLHLWQASQVSQKVPTFSFEPGECQKLLKASNLLQHAPACDGTTWLLHPPSNLMQQFWNFHHSFCKPRKCNCRRPCLNGEQCFE